MKSFQFEETEQLLQQFRSHGLNDLNRAALMNRVDSKFLIPVELMPKMLTAMADYYSVLQIGDRRLFKYDNVYYDTNDLNFYHAHHRGKLNRYKVRYRNYVDSDLAFLEVKFKNNKKRTDKQRIKVSGAPDEVIEVSQEFLKSTGIADPGALKMVQRGSYYRLALANEAAAERLTIDMALKFSTADRENPHQLSDFIIAELKQERLNRHSPFYQLMRSYGIRPGRFSKYCMGMCFAYGSQLKSNNFKDVFLKIRSMHH